MQTVICDKGVRYTKSCKYLFRLFDHSAGSKVVQVRYLNIVTVVVTDNQQYPVVKLTEILTFAQCLAVNSCCSICSFSWPLQCVKQTSHLEMYFLMGFSHSAYASLDANACHVCLLHEFLPQNCRDNNLLTFENNLILDG